MEQDAAQQQTLPVQLPVQFVRDEDFTNLYANHITSELSVWDLKVIFGILDQSSQPNKIVQHTAMNIPWAQVKLISYFMRIALALHEGQNGKVSIPKLLVPADPNSFANPDDPLPPEVQDKMASIYRDFLASL